MFFAVLLQVFVHIVLLLYIFLGSGKTLAFALPVILEIIRLRKLSKYKSGDKLLAIVLEPTRELASQVIFSNIFVMYCRHTNNSLNFPKILI